MNNTIKLLMESLFDDLDDLFDNDEEDVMSDVISEFTKDQLYKVLTEMFHTDKFKGWKKDKDKENHNILTCIKKGNYGGTNKYMTDVFNLFLANGFTHYKNTELSYCFVHNFDYHKYNGMVGYGHININAPYFQGKIKELNDFRETFYKLPDIVLEYFSKDPLCSDIYLSPDEGIMLVVYKYTLFRVNPNNFSWDDCFTKCVIRLTGKKMYKQLSNDELKKIQDNTDYKQKRIDFIKAKFNNAYKSKDIITYFTVGKNNIPYGILYFNWHDNILKNKKTLQKYNLPYYLIRFLESLFYMYNELEKEDDNADCELVKDGIKVKFIKDCDITNAKYKLNSDTENPDSCIICELEDYLLDIYNYKFNKNKR